MAAMSLVKAKMGASVAAPLSLQDRIEALRIDLERLIDERVAELATPGLPSQVVRQMITGGGFCECRTALKIFADRSRDEEIAKRHQT
jgi:hypothetical protein